jgi:FkbH-like protein
VIVCLCTKNDENDLRDLFDRRPDLVLRPEHLGAIRANWDSKARNIQDLAAELNLALESFIFLDDDPVECADVRRLCPQVLCFHMPAESGRAAAFVERLWVLRDPEGGTAEDAQRAGFYRANVSRLALRRAVSDYRSYLANLQVKITVRPAADADRKRIVQLVQRTTQFTITGRLSSSEVESLQTEHALVVDVEDRYGHYGTVGAAAWTIERQVLVVSLFALSCRALGRRVEHAMCEQLASMAREAGATRILVRLRTTGRNQPARSFFQALPHETADSEPQSLVFTTAAWAQCSEILDAVPQEVDADQDDRPAEERVERAAPVFDAETLAEGLSWIASALDSPSALASVVNRSPGGFAPEDEGAARHRPEADGVLAGIRALWLEVLPDADSADDAEFFANGGDSLIAMKLLTLIRQRQGVEITPDQMFEGPLTLKWLADLVEGEQLRRADPALLERVMGQVAVLSDEEIASISRAQQH